MASVREVAREAGVSIATVSRVLNGNQSVAEELRERVLEAANACQYWPTQDKTATRIGWMYLSDFYLDCPYDAACFDGVGTAIRQTPYDLVLLDIGRDRLPGESVARFAARKGIAGAVVRAAIEQRSVIREMAEGDLPFVVIGDHFECENARFVHADSRAASREAIEHLIELGHKRTACVLCDREDGDHFDRLEAYRDVMREAGLYRPDDEHRVPPFRMDGAPLARRLLSTTDRPTAMFVADPLTAVGVISEAHSLGAKLGHDLSIVGVDDTDTRHTVYPKMTAVCQDSRRIGEQAIERLQALIAGARGVTASANSHAAWFEIHETTGAAPPEVRRFLRNGG